MTIEPLRLPDAEELLGEIENATNQYAADWTDYAFEGGGYRHAALLRAETGHSTSILRGLDLLLSEQATDSDRMTTAMAYFVEARRSLVATIDDCLGLDRRRLGRIRLLGAAAGGALALVDRSGVGLTLGLGAAAYFGLERIDTPEDPTRASLSFDGGSHWEISGDLPKATLLQWMKYYRQLKKQAESMRRVVIAKRVGHGAAALATMTAAQVARAVF